MTGGTKLRRRAIVLVAMLLWIGLLLYPAPRMLAVSFKRLARPPIDAEAVRRLAAELPDDPAEVEAFSQRTLPYMSSWRLYGVPWYFPTVSEVLRDKAGDCQAEAILTASILEAKGLPYTLRYSFDHVWVDYPGKPATGLEDPATSFAGSSGKGWLAALPDRIPLRDIVEARAAYHWNPMPAERKWAMLAGLILLLAVAEGVPDLVLQRLRSLRLQPHEVFEGGHSRIPQGGRQNADEEHAQRAQPEGGRH
ncbi:MAG: hypothetical protein Kow00129_00980 [Thermoleophilia bacterium]